MTALGLGLEYDEDLQSVFPEHFGTEAEVTTALASLDEKEEFGAVQREGGESGGQGRGPTLPTRQNPGARHVLSTVGMRWSKRCEEWNGR